MKETAKHISETPQRLGGHASLKNGRFTQEMKVGRSVYIDVNGANVGVRQSSTCVSVTQGKPVKHVD